MRVGLDRGGVMIQDREVLLCPVDWRWSQKLLQELAERYRYRC